jgi:hypothetical protein
MINQNSVTEKNGMKLAMKQINLNSARLLAGACGLFTILALTPAGFARRPRLRPTP